MRKAAWMVVGVLVGAGALWAAQAAARAPSRYEDNVYGFSLTGPVFPAVAKGGTVIPVMLLGSGEGGFSSNVNVMVQRVGMTRDAYRELSLSQFKTAGFKVNSDKDLTVSGRDAILWDYEGKQGNFDLRWLALAVIDTDRVLLVTCTALKDAFPKVEKEFTACLNSFQLKAAK